MEDLTTRLIDLGTPDLVALGVLVIAQLTLMVLALVSLVRRSPAALRGPKWLWALVIIFGEIVGPIVYFAVARAPEHVDVATSAAVPRRQADSVADMLYGDKDGKGSS